MWFRFFLFFCVEMRIDIIFPALIVIGDMAEAASEGNFY